MKNNYKNTGLIYAEPNDPRDVYTSSLFGGTAAKKNRWGSNTDDLIEILGVENQERQSSCVMQTFSKLMEIYHWKETGSVIKYSARYPYVLADTFYHGRRNSGLNPINGLKFLFIYGDVTDEIVADTNSVSAYDYYKDIVLITDQDKVVKIGGYAFVPKNNLEETKKALDELGALGMAISNGNFSRFGKLTAGGDSNHMILVTEIELRSNGKHKVYFINSWGEKWGKDGVGYFYYEDLVEDGGEFFMYTAVSQFNREVVEKIKEEVENNKTKNVFIDDRAPNFPIYELVPKAVFEKDGANAFRYIDQNILLFIQAYRTFRGKAIKVNNWKYGGALQYRGFDDGGYRGLSSKSQHRFGRALDFSIAGESSEDTRKNIIANIDKLFEMAGLDSEKYCLWIENGTSGWVHIDIRNDPSKAGMKVYTFNP